jgi:hypothetical protein
MSHFTRKRTAFSQVLLLANPEFDKELAGTAQVAKGLEIV